MNDRLCWEAFDKYNYILHYIRYRKHQVYERLFGLDYMKDYNDSVVDEETDVYSENKPNHI